MPLANQHIPIAPVAKSPSVSTARDHGPDPAAVILSEAKNLVASTSMPLANQHIPIAPVAALCPANSAGNFSSAKSPSVSTARDRGPDPAAVILSRSEESRPEHFLTPMRQRHQKALRHSPHPFVSFVLFVD